MVARLNALFLLLAAFPHVLRGITTVHHDKPEQSRISEMATKMTQSQKAVPSSVERQKRLLPYVNYYLSGNEQKHRKFTPFLESNALPGPFIPIVKTATKNVDVEQAPPTESVISPNYAEIYDTLARLKQAQEAMKHRYNTIYRKPISYVPATYYNELHRHVPPMKTVVDTYTPTHIDIDVDNERAKYAPEADYKLSNHKVSGPRVEDKPVYDYRTQTVKLSEKPIIVAEERQPERTQNGKPVIYAVRTTPKPQVNIIAEEEYFAQKLVPSEVTHYVPAQEYYPSGAPPPPTENILPKILKQLQLSNTLPQTFTPQNIDNSIRTLIKILNGLRKQQKIKGKPIVVDLKENLGEGDLSEGPGVEKPAYPPGTLTQVFPANTIDGGTPGRPGVDYPALSSIPQTDFNCKKQRYKGFFGDPRTHCQVWHYCDLNGGQASFLCPNGTIFSQVALTCDWWYNVKCSSTPQLYVLNERLYKYILPLTPKFPEDYTGPLVDRYLALKFEEMEEKMKKERKEEDKSEEKDDSN